MGDKDKKDTGNVVICGARSCIFNKDNKCNGLMDGIITVISVNGTCIKFETKDKK